VSACASGQKTVPAPPLTRERKSLNWARAIREQCIECMGFLVQLVNRCPDLACPLWEWSRGPGGPELSEVPIRRQGLPGDRGTSSGKEDCGSTA